jgi:hypothetical protein
MRSIALATSLLFLSSAALAATPLQFAAPNVQAPPDPQVDGARFSVLHGENASVHGVDLGLLSLSETESLTGFSAVLGISRVTGRMQGCSSALMNVHSSRDTGLNAAFVNRVHTIEQGANVGFVNVTDDYTLVDVGGLNVSDRSTAQLGFINVTEKLESFQLGFINVAKNGFLPVFPIFNFPKR